MEKKYAIFDMDGTLVDSMGYWEQLGREYLGSKGIVQNVDQVLAQIVPMTMAEAAELFVRVYGMDCTGESLAADLDGMMEEHYRRDVCLKPGVAEYLDGLAAQGCQMCVATATARPLAQLCLERLGIAERFEFILSCDEVNAGKSRPDIFLEAARRMGTSPSGTAVFEDALHAARTAGKAGFWVVGVRDRQTTEEWEALSDLADELVCDWREMR